MINRFFQNFRVSSGIIRLKIQGPINNSSQLQFTQKLNRIQQLRSDAILVVVNSFGGSLQSAKNMSARLKKLADNKKVPIYCFAEQFCLNSANLILTAGTQCFAHKFSVIGDFGFVYEGIDTQEFEKQYKIKQNNISTMKVQYKTNILTQSIIPTNKTLIQKILKDSEQNLKEQIYKNRSKNMTPVQKQEYSQNIENQSGFFDINKSLQFGLVDSIIGIEEYIIQNYPKKRIIEGTGKGFSHPIMESVRSLKESIQYSDK